MEIFECFYREAVAMSHDGAIFEPSTVLDA